MVNPQGQLTPTERALNRAAPGFAMMLQGVQQYANRVEENRRLAEQRSFQRERDTNQFENQKELTRFAHDLNTKSTLELEEQRQRARMAEIEAKEDIRRSGAMFDIGVQSTEEASNLRRLVSYDQSIGAQQADIDSGKRASQLFERQQDRLTSVQDKYPMLRNLRLASDNQGNPVYVQTVNLGNGEVMERIVSPAEFSILQEEAVTLVELADGIKQFRSEADLNLDDARKLIELESSVRAGTVSVDEANRNYAMLAAGVNERRFSPEQQREGAQQARQAGAAILPFYHNSVTGELMREMRPLEQRLPQGQRMFSTNEIRADQELQAIVARSGGNFTQVQDQIRRHLITKYASIQTMYTAASQADFGKTVTRGINKYRQIKQNTGFTTIWVYWR
jgi:hypothetical protein